MKGMELKVGRGCAGEWTVKQHDCVGVSKDL